MKTNYYENDYQFDWVWIFFINNSKIILDIEEIKQLKRYRKESKIKKI